MKGERRNEHVRRCVLDSGGLTALCGMSAVARGELYWVLEFGDGIRVPTPILAECTTGDGGRDAEVNRILRVLGGAAAAIVAPTEETARRAGRLRFRARTDDGIDALVAAEAVGDGTKAVVLTSDPDDLRKLLVRHPHVLIRKV